jgi:hypothetical protein
MRDPEAEARRVRNYALFSGIPAFLGLVLGILAHSPVLIGLTVVGCVISVVGIAIWSRRIAQARAEADDPSR